MVYFWFPMVAMCAHQNLQKYIYVCPLGEHMNMNMNMCTL